MKIIRHSHKVFVYSISLLLSAQQISCMQQQAAPAAHPDQKSIHQLTIMLNEHNNVDQLIDTMQKAIGGMDDQDGTSHHMFTVTLPARGREPIKHLSLTHAELAEKLYKMQDQRQIYDDAFWFNWNQYWAKDHNKRIIRSNFVPIVTLAYAKRCKDFNPDTTLINNLPKSAQALNSLNIITRLQAGFADIDHKKTCLSLSVSDILGKLSTMHHFFDNPPCCWYSSEEKAKNLEYNVFLRSHVIPYSYFIERQKRLKALALPKQIPAADDQSAPQKDNNPPSSRSKKSSILIIDGDTVHHYHPSDDHQPPTYTDKPHPLSQVANPFIPGSGLGNIQHDEDDDKK